MSKQKKIIIAVTVLVLLIALIILAFIFLPAKVDKIDGVIVEPEMSSITGTGMIYTIINRTSGIIEFSPQYALECKGIIGWYKLSVKSVLTSWNTVTYTVDTQSNRNIEVDWSRLYGSLKTGTYRLIKNVKLDDQDYTLAVEFSIS